VRAVPREDWARTTVGQAMRPVERLAVARPDQALTQALPGLAQDGGELMPVVDGGRLVGVLTHADVIQYLHARQGSPSDAAGQRVA